MALRNTIQFTLWSLGIKFVVGMTIALILNSRIPARGLISGIMLLPWIVPEIVTALAWRSIYDPLFGGLNPILRGLGLIDRPVGWLSEPQLAMSSVITVNIWKGIPFYTLLLLAGLKAIDRELLEAAEVDGANVVQRFRHVTLPGLRYVIVVVLLLSFISTFNQFGLPYLMTGGGPSGATRLYSILAYEKALGALQYGPGSAIALSVAPLMAVIIWLLGRFMRQDDRKSRQARDADGRGSLPGVHRRCLRPPSRPDFPGRFELVVNGRRRSPACCAARSAAAGRPLMTKDQRLRWGMAGRLARPRADHAVRAVPVLLGLHHVVQNHVADQRAHVDLLAVAVHAGAVLPASVPHAVRDLVREFRPGRHRELHHLGGLRGARGLRAVAAEVHRRRAPHELPAHHLPAAADADLHPALPDPERPSDWSTPTAR